MSRVMLMLVYILIICSIQPVYSQTATSLVERDPGKQYLLVKKIVKDEILKRKDSFINYDTEGRSLDLYYCSNYDELGSLFTHRPDRLSKLLEVAFDIDLYEITLKSAGYPEFVWGDFLRNREKIGLTGKDISPSDNNLLPLKAFAKILNNYRNNGHGALPSVKVEGGCGAGGITVSFKTNPPGARVLLVPKMYYSLCKAQGINPEDEQKCDFWHEVFAGQSPDVSGDYFAKLVWEDHTVIRNFNATKLDDGNHKVTLQ